MAMPPASGDREITNAVVKISDLAINENVIEGLTFSNCKIIGPAILIPMDGTGITHCGFSGSAEAIYWPIEPDRNWVVGAIGISNCVFSKCQFDNIGFGGGDQLKEMLSAIEIEPTN